jgi:hypothetical protein
MKKRATLGGMDNVLYVGIDLHERESQLAIFEKDGALVEEKRLATGELASFLSSLPGEKRVAIESVGFVYPKKAKTRATPSNPKTAYLRLMHQR